MINVVPKSIMHNDSEIIRADHNDAPFVTTFGPLLYTIYFKYIEGFKLSFVFLLFGDRYPVTFARNFNKGEKRLKKKIWPEVIPDFLTVV